MKKVWQVELKDMDIEWITEGVYSTSEAAFKSIAGETMDFEQASDTEVFIETTEGKWFVTEHEVLD